MTLPAQDIVERLRDAMDGVTPGPWFEGDKWVFVPPLDPKNNASSALRNILRDVPEDELQANCAYIALCSPDNIGALLDTISRLTADNEALRKNKQQLEERLASAYQAKYRCNEDANSERSCRQASESRADALAQEVERLKAEIETYRTAFDGIGPSSRIAALEAEVGRLRTSLRDQFCPRPCNWRPSEFDVGDCVDAGECGCSARAALANEEAGL